MPTICTYNIRLYKCQDYDKVLDRLVSKTYLRKYLNKPIHFRLLKLLHLYDSSLYILEDVNAQIIAAGVIRRKFNFHKLSYTFWFYGIDVIKELRGNGIGTIMVSGMMDILRRKNVDSVFLHVAKDNKPAIGLYRKLGFQELSIAPNEYIFYAKLLDNKND